VVSLHRFFKLRGALRAAPVARCAADADAAHADVAASASRARQIRAYALATATVIAVLAILAASAQAIVTEIPTESGTTVVGLDPRNAEHLYTPGATPTTFSNPEGSPILTHTNVYAIYWDPKGWAYHGDWQQLIDNFFYNIGAESESSDTSTLFAVAPQYADLANQHAAYSTTFRGAYHDTEPYPPTETCEDPEPLREGQAIVCLTDKQIRAQLEQFIRTHELQKGMESLFYILTPPGVTVCVDKGGPTGHCSSAPPPSESSTPLYKHSFCSYHGDISPTNPTKGDANTILYAMIPWTAGIYPDGHLGLENQHTTYDCQDGGFDPTSHPQAEEQEHKHEKGTKEKEELKKLSPAEQLAAEEAEEREGPHPEEPNQPLNAPGPDGYYDTGLADLIINQIAIEQQNTITDPLLDGWQDSKGNEDIDECRNFFAPTLGGSSTAEEHTDAGTLYNQVINGHDYYLNDAFNLAAMYAGYPGVPCIPGINFVPSFTTPNTVATGQLVGFNGMESDITLDAGIKYTASGEEQLTYPIFSWNFGDGTPTVTGYAPGGPTLNSPSAFTCNYPWLEPCAASTFHSYQYGGTYTVTLTETDIAGNTASVSHEVTVVGPLPPPPPAPPTPPAPPAGSSASSSAGGGSSAGSAGGGGSGAGGASGLPGPVAKAIAASSSLSQALHHGLLVTYSVNEQVAGSFVVLLETGTAHRLGIKGATAKGLPAGSPSSLIVGRALLVTTKGGHAAVRVKFTKSAARHLKHVGKVTLTLRLIVRDAASQHPQSTTVLSTVQLHR
jgi:hypothetical protein